MPERAHDPPVPDTPLDHDSAVATALQVIRGDLQNTAQDAGHSYAFLWRPFPGHDPVELTVTRVGRDAAHVCIARIIGFTVPIGPATAPDRVRMVVQMEEGVLDAC